MIDVKTFYSKLKINDYMSKYVDIYHNESKDKDKLYDLKFEYIDFLTEEVKKLPMEELIALIVTLSNIDPEIVNGLIVSNDERILRAVLLIEFFNGLFPSTIKKDPEEAAKIAYHYAQDNDDADRLAMYYNKYEQKYDVLARILKTKDEKIINKNIINDYIEFAKKFINIEQIFFFDPVGNYIFNKRRVIDSFFSSSFVDIETLQKIYDEVLLKNKFLKVLNHESLLLNGKSLDTKIKGLYRKCGKEYCDYYYFSYNQLSSISSKDISNRIKKIIELNQDDETGLLLFFEKIRKYSAKSTLKYLKQFDYYEKYSSEKFKALLDENVDKLLNGNCDIDREVLEYLGNYECFLNRYDEFLELFYKSEDNHYKEVIMLPLAHGLINKLNKKHGLNVGVEYSSKLISYKKFGYYSSTDNEIFINPYIFELFEDKKVAFVDAINLVFHEMRHAVQDKIIEYDESFNYDNLLMAIENIIVITDREYSRKNYYNLSYERDARDVAYVETMEFFKGKEEYQKLLEKEKEKNIIDDYVRLDQYNRYFSIVKFFCSHLTKELIRFSESPDFVRFYIEDVKKYPVIFKFFDIDFKRGTVKYKDNKYFEEQLKIMESKPDSLEKKEAINAIKSFQYAVRIADELPLIEQQAKELESEGAKDDRPKPNR